MNKRLYRSRREKMIGGVCGGLADYFNIDPVIMRVLFVALTIGPGIGLLTYIILWIIVPEEPIIIKNNTESDNIDDDSKKSSDEFKTTNVDVNSEKRKNNSGVIFATILILIGTFWLMENIFPFLTFDIWLPLILIAIGIVILLTKRD